MRKLKILAFSVFIISVLVLIGVGFRPAASARFSGMIVSPEAASLNGSLVWPSLTPQLKPQGNPGLQPATGRQQQAQSGDKLARLALGMFMYRIKKYIGAYYFILGGVDAVCFTAGIGENNPDMIAEFKKDIRKIAKNKTKVMVIPTDEELMIAKLSYDLIIKNYN